MEPARGDFGLTWNKALEAGGVVVGEEVKISIELELVKADAPAKNVAVSYKADCMGCHVPAAKTDRVFIQGYPTLTDAVIAANKKK